VRETISAKPTLQRSGNAGAYSIEAANVRHAHEWQVWRDVNVLGGRDTFNQSLEKANRVADFLEFAELMCRDAIERDESCGCHLREEHQTEDGEAVRDDERFANVTVWEYPGEGGTPRSYSEQLTFDTLKPVTRSYK